PAGLLPFSGWTISPPLVRWQEDRERDREVLEERRRGVSEVRGDVGRGLRSRRADAPRPAGSDRRTGFAPPPSGSRGPPPAPAVLQRGRTPRRILRIGRGQGRLCERERDRPFLRSVGAGDRVHPRAQPPR